MTTFAEAVKQKILVPKAHTQIVKAMMNHAGGVLGGLGAFKVVTGKKERFKQVDIFKAALKVNMINASTKTQIQAVIGVLPEVRKGLRQLSQPEAAAVRKILSSIDNSKGIGDMLRRLRSLQSQMQKDPTPGLKEGLAIAISIIEDGQASIYDPALPFYAFSGNKKPIIIANTIAGEDAKGAVSGAVGGAVVGAAVGGVGAGPGAAAGAVGGGVSASVGQVAQEIYDSLTGSDDVLLLEDILDDIPPAPSPT